eukprot:4886508-Prymnesium_polylepis.2
MRQGVCYHLHPPRFPRPWCGGRRNVTSRCHYYSSTSKWVKLFTVLESPHLGSTPQLSSSRLAASYGAVQ